LVAGRVLGGALPFAFIFTSASQLVIAVLAAAFGAMALRVARRFGMRQDTDARRSSG
jgi:hypothetical protein